MLKEEVLSMLLNAQEPVSGEGICKTFGVTRAAVWKTIDQLRQEGYGIDAAPKRGYTLAFVPERLDTALVRAHLSGHPWQALTTAVPSVDSTNNACKRLAAEGAPDGTAILTGCQTAGRGRRGRTFVSPPGGLYMSILLRPEIGARQAVGLTAMAAVAAARAAEKLCGAPIRIKWVNDLWKNGRKVCGILTEAALDLESGMLDYAVLGLGFNVVAPAEGWPAELQSVAGALFDGDPAPGARAALAAAFLNEFWPLYRTGPRSGYLDEYRSRLALAGHRVLVTPRSGTPRPAAVLGIDDECRLVVRYDGESRPAALTSGEAGVRLL